MSLIRKNDEHWRDNLIGCTFNKRLEKAVMQRHGLEVKEQSKRVISESAICTALNPKTNKILDIGFNCPNDMILNNFGTWLAGMIRQPVSQRTAISLTNTANGAQTVSVYETGNNLYAFNYYGNSGGAALGTTIQLGSGTTAAARTDYKIQTALGTAPESSAFSTNGGSYAAGAISFSGAVTAGGADTVNEMAFLSNWYVIGGVVHVFALFHDILSSGVAFVAGNTLNASYSITL